MRDGKKMAAPRNVNPELTAVCASADFTAKIRAKFLIPKKTEKNVLFLILQRYKFETIHNQIG